MKRMHGVLVALALGGCFSPSAPSAEPTTAPGTAIYFNHGGAFERKNIDQPVTQVLRNPEEAAAFIARHPGVGDYTYNPSVSESQPVVVVGLPDMSVSERLEITRIDEFSDRFEVTAVRWSAPEGAALEVGRRAMVAMAVLPPKPTKPVTFAAIATMTPTP